MTPIEENGLMLAVFGFASYSTAVHKLETDDRIVMYTDRGCGGFQRCRRFLRSRCIVRSADENSRAIPRDGGRFDHFFCPPMVGKAG